MNTDKPRKKIQQNIEKLAESVQIDELADRLGIAVKRANGRAVAQCIFHNDTNPSMALYPSSAKDKSHYHCFVCDSHGDIFDLVKKTIGVDFVGAVNWLASTYGLSSVAAGESQRPKKSRAPEETTNLPMPNIAAFELALGIYREKSSGLLNDWLIKRGFPSKISVDAELCLVTPRTLVRYLEDQYQDFGSFRELLGQLENVGLVRGHQIKAEAATTAANYLDLGRQYRDFFNDGRVIFPIRDVRNRLVGFAGRKIDDESQAPKYLYSSGLPKSQLLYRAHKAFALISSAIARGEQPVIYVCEGLLDALRMEALGFAAVAVLGSRLSESQSRLIIEFASTLPDLRPLHVRFFLDLDGPGLKGATSSIELALKLDTEIRLEMGFVWPTDSEAGQNLDNSSLKDPDELLKLFSDSTKASTYLDRSTHPVAVALLAEKLNIRPDDILEDQKWESLPLGAKYRIASHLENVSGGLISRILQTESIAPPSEKKWNLDIVRYLKAPRQKSDPKLADLTPQQAALQLNLARELARSGANKGEVLADIAGWRRLSIAATAFNEGFTSRLKQAQFQPIEPFDAIYVSRGFGKSEERLKAMPCPEDLVIQQYVMNELLTERLDDGTGKRFSNYIPAVRYYRSLKRHRTTGEIEGTENKDTLSFAYQIDMEVLEGIRPPGDNGMFRPYFECWKDFISSLLAQGREMNHVHMVRLDFKRYYDRIQRTILKDLLQRSIAPGYQNLNDPSAFAPLFQPKNLDTERQNAAIDFLLEQSFGYTYFDPETGAPTKSDRECGIPQGPVLSAWLGNIVLFKLDAALRAKLDVLNHDGEIRAGYARYVDDVVLLGNSLEILSTLRAATEDVARALQLEVLSKESFAPMSRAEFSEHLTSGRALAASGPREEPVLLESGDGDAGWDMLTTDKPRRQTSLELLRDPRLYTLPPETIQNQIFTALRAEDLRPAELSKAARWLWYQAASSMSDDEYDANAVVSCYWRIWHSVCTNAPFSLSPDIAWDDPAFYALEGLESLFERANSPDFSLTPEELSKRTLTIAKLARVARSPEFAKMFDESEHPDTPLGWGSGTRQLRRMFFQRIICMQWKSVRLTDKTPNLGQFNASVKKAVEGLSSVLQGSLRRSLITDAETWKLSGTGIAVTGYGENDRNPLGDAFIWLHRSIVAFGVDDYLPGTDPLAGHKSELAQIESHFRDIKAAHFSVTGDKFLPLLHEILCREHSEDTDLEPDQDRLRGEVLLLALQTLAVIAPREQLAHLLASRVHLFQEGGVKLPLSPLPGIPAKGLLLISPTDIDGHWTKIATIWWITLSNIDPVDPSPPLPSFKAASAGGKIQEIKPNWQIQEKVEALEIYKATWDILNTPSYAFASAPVLPISPKDLGWIADAFEAIARLNHSNDQDAERDRKEYVPAWPYVVTSSRPDIQDGLPLMFTLLTPCYSTASIDGLAFVRDGIQGLCTYKVLEPYGHHWRVGVLLSDLFGFQRDIDQYAALTVPDLVDKDGHVTLEPAAHLLRNVLRKLRGSFAKGAVLKTQSGDEHLPATIARSLDLLRRFPQDGEWKHSIAYVLSSEAETVAMHARLAGNVALEYKGIGAAYAARVGLRVAARVPLGWAGSLVSSLDNIITLPTSRAIPCSYLDLSCKFASLLAAGEIFENRNRSFAILVVGLRLAAIVAWLREVTLSIEAMDQSEKWPLPKDGDVADSWKIEECGFLFSEPKEGVNSLSDYFRKNIGDGSTQKWFAEITPLGWLVLLTGRVGLLGQITQRVLNHQWTDEDIRQTKALALHLSATAIYRSADDDDVHPDWPFEFDNLNVLEQWLSSALCDSAACIAQIESNVGLQLMSQRKASWRFDPSDCSFVDADGEKWEIKHWQILLSSGSKPERIKIGRRLLNIWDETKDTNGNLVLVTARDERLGRLLSGAVHPEREGTENVDIRTDDQTPDVKPYNSDSRHDVQGPLNKDVGNPNLPSHVDPTVEPAVTALAASSNKELSDQGEQRNDSRMQWRSLQEQSWKKRSLRSPGHTRIAIMQWDLDETYHHPIIDSVKWEKKWPPDKSLFSFEESKNEHRRQKLISEVLNACENFAVDLLVLPEYSVRPDTIKWLRDQLLRRSGMPSVLAGTYKLHGNISDVGFDKTHQEILGLSDHLKTFGAAISSKKRSNTTHSSGEHSAMLTLLSPLKLNDGKQIVCAFSRRKKYPSLAAVEIFNPPLEAIRPLFSAEGLLDELQARSTDGSRVPTGPSRMSISAKDILNYATKLRHLEFLAEFVCSELFLPMSVSNHQVLAKELQKLAIRFGFDMSDEAAMKSVIEDVELMAKYLGIANFSGEIKRRSILVVPAMTTRSADYWIFGQAALLSGGTTTVFCNAVSKGEKGEDSAIGGSCFIGRDSWNGSAKSAHHDKAITPYAGWSKGIYYSQRTDALGKSEQAVVIADIDPSFMQEGKPRPQALAVPLQLVAYLPMVEVKDAAALEFSSDMESNMMQFNPTNMLGRVVNPADPGIDQVQTLISTQCSSECSREKNSFAERYQHWKKYWRVNQFAGVPPALVDWIWADTTVPSTHSVKIFTPSCTGEQLTELDFPQADAGTDK